jgi:hypothetical protein
MGPHIVAEPTSKEMGVDRPATSKTGANRRGIMFMWIAWNSPEFLTFSSGIPRNS